MWGVYLICQSDTGYEATVGMTGSETPLLDIFLLTVCAAPYQLYLSVFLNREQLNTADNCLPLRHTTHGSEIGLVWGIAKHKWSEYESGPISNMKTR